MSNPELAYQIKHILALSIILKLVLLLETQANLLITSTIGTKDDCRTVAHPST